MQYYYYLNEQKEVQGPFTAEQMRRMMAAGTIDGNTLASAAGGGEWQPLDSLHLGGDAAQDAPQSPESPAALLGECPHCRKMLEGAELPALCPHCGKPLHPGTESLWENAVYAFKQMGNFRGRATRREFWSYYLFSSLVAFALQMLGSVGEVIGVDPDGNAAVPLLVGIVLMLVGLLLVLFHVSLFVAELAVTVRRLHDTGHSGWWAASPYACGLVAIPGIILAVVARDPGMVAGIFAFVGMLAALGFGIYLFIQMLMPSQCGPNKYGPSVLFPRLFP